jgi:glucokinase
MSGRFLAVDVGGSRVKAAIVTTNAVEEQPPEAVASTLDDLVHQIVRLYMTVAAGDRLSWGICMPGLIDGERGIIRYSASLRLRDVAILDLLAEHVPPPKVFVNDLVAAATGEAAGRTLALLQIGTGIAGRSVVNGAVATGTHGYAGEVGHLAFRPDGRACSCGRTGCAEAYGGWGGIRRRYEESGRQASTPDGLAHEARSDPWAAAVLEDALAAVGFAASALVSVCDPGTLRLGGGLAQAWGELLAEAVRRELERNVLPAIAATTHVETTTLGDRASLLGLHSLAAGTRRMS